MDRSLRQSSQKKRAAMVAAATRLFLERGFEGVSMDAIAELAEVSKRTLYNHFNDKYALFEAVIALLCERVLPPPSPDTLKHGELRATLEKFGVELLRSIYTPDQIELYRTVAHDARRFPQLGLMMMEGPIQRTHTVVSAYLRARQAAGELELADPDRAAAQFVGMLKADVQMKLLFGTRSEVSAAEIASLARSAVELFLHGALATRATGHGERVAEVRRKKTRRRA